MIAISSRITLKWNHSSTPMMGTPSSQMRGDRMVVMRPPSSGGNGIMLIRLMKKPV